MSKEDKDLIDYVVVCISEFALRCGMHMKDAYTYLRDYKGIDFLQNFYDAEHILSFDDVMDDLTVICRRNGGNVNVKLHHGPNVEIDKQQEMIELTTQDIIAFLVEDSDYKIETAMDLFYNSETFAKLSDVETGLYLQGSSYVYEMLRQNSKRSE